MKVAMKGVEARIVEGLKIEVDGALQPEAQGSSVVKYIGQCPGWRGMLAHKYSMKY